jgi:hypothetical protein
LRASYQNKMHSTRSRRRNESHQVDLEVFLFTIRALKSAELCRVQPRPRRWEQALHISSQMAICTRCVQAAADAAEIRTAQRMVVDAVLVVEAGVGRHLMSSRRHSPRWRASERGRWRRQWWRGARGWGQRWTLMALPETVRRRGGAGGWGAWSCMLRQRRTRCGRWSRRRRP